MMARKHKYNAQPTTVDGIRFHSKGEANRYSQLKLLERLGDISDLSLQPSFPLVVNDHKICTYKADFKYIEDGQEIIEDFKGYDTRDSKMKRYLLKALHGIDVRITGKGKS